MYLLPSGFDMTLLHVELIVPFAPFLTLLPLRKRSVVRIRTRSASLDACFPLILQSWDWAVKERYGSTEI